MAVVPMAGVVTGRVRGRAACDRHDDRDGQRRDDGRGDLEGLTRGHEVSPPFVWAVKPAAEGSGTKPVPADDRHPAVRRNATSVAQAPGSS
jgi:hypothetical protein